MFNLGTGHGYSVKEVLAKAEEVTGRRIPYVVAPRRAGDPARLIADGSRARKLLGWRPQRSDLDSIMTDAWRFLRRHAAQRITFSDQHYPKRAQG